MPPIVFTQVCRWWRDPAHPTPALWCKISIQIPLLVVPPTGTARNVTQSKIASRQATLIALQAHKMLSVSFRIHQLLFAPPDSIRYVPYRDWDVPPVFVRRVGWIFEMLSKYLHVVNAWRRSPCLIESFTSYLLIIPSMARLKREHHLRLCVLYILASAVLHRLRDRPLEIPPSMSGGVLQLYP